MKLFYIVTAFGYITVCQAVQQQFTFYTESFCTGEQLILNSKTPYLDPEDPIISTHKSVSYNGVWAVYRTANYTTPTPGGLIFGGQEYSKCYNHRLAVKPILSIRYLGPPDTTTHSISVYDEIFLAGQELIITEEGHAYIPFEVKSAFSIIGNTTWTFHTGNNFHGLTQCYNPNFAGWSAFLISLDPTWSNVGSISKGCNLLP